MIKKWCLYLVLIPVVVLSMGANKQKNPPKVGEKGPRIILFNGGRPWQGEGKAKMFSSAGCKVTSLDSRYLDGFGGATLKVNVGDTVEPDPFDGITKTLDLKKLISCKLIIFHNISEKNLSAILTPERVAILHEYVEKGGNILFTINAPRTLESLLPVKPGDYEDANDFPLQATRPAGNGFEIFPEKLPVFKQFRVCELLPGCEVLSMICTEDGNPVTPYIARRQIGKGTVTFLNTESQYAHQLKEYSNWAYSNAFLVAVAANSGNIKLDAEKFITKMQDIPERKQVGEVAVDVKTPELGITEVSSAPVIADNVATFGDGSKVQLLDNGSVSVTFPGEEKPFIKKFSVPEISYSSDRTFFNAATAEANDEAATITAADIKWAVKSFTVDGNKAVITYTAPDSEMRWVFTAGKLQLDGRDFSGVAEHIEVVKCPLLLNTIHFKSELTPVKPLFARRNSCYSPPRGYAEFDMTGEKDADTYSWAFFGSGQPFELLVCEDSVYLANIASPQSISPKMIRKKGSPVIENSRSQNWGRIHAPAQTADYWHWFSRGPERGHNDYLAMYQFLRQYYRRQVGLKELPVYPNARYTHQITKDEQEAVRDAAAKVGFRFLRLTGCEEPADVSFSPRRFDLVSGLKAKGVSSSIWTAGSYVQGDGGWIYQNHPEWFVRDKKGKIFAYGNGRYPVIDINNEDYLQWYFSIAKPAVEAGIGWVYRDMDGAAANCINYAKPESPHGMASQIRVYKFFHELGCRVGIEGMNPLVIDEYWYRPALYQPFAGNEFSLVGSVPSGNFWEALELDFFRTGMFGCFITIELSGYTFQFDRVKDEVVRVNRLVSLVPKFNEALDNTGMPFIRETEFGTTWIGEKGGALFFWNPAKKVTVDLPQGWKIKGVDGNVLTDVQPDAIYLLEKAN